MAMRLLKTLGQPSATHAPGALTERELAVLKSLAAGASNRSIGDQLFLTEGTVKNSVSVLLEKLGSPTARRR